MVKQETGRRTDDIVPSGRVFPWIHLACDLAAVSLAWRAALELRIFLNSYLPLEIPRGAIQIVALKLVYVLLLWVVVSVVLGTYRQRNHSSLVSALLRVAESAAVVSALAITVTFFSRQLGAELSRSLVLIFSPVCFLLLNGSLALSIYVTRRVDFTWPAPQRVAVVGVGPYAEDVVRAIRETADPSVTVRGLIVPERPDAVEARAARTSAAVSAVNSAGSVVVTVAARTSGVAPALSPVATPPVLGTVRQLPELINRECLDRIILSGGSLYDFEEEYCGQVAARMGVTVSRIFRAPGPAVSIRYQPQYGMHLIDITPAPFTRWQEVIKRGIDILASLALITLLLPLLMLIAVMIRLTSRGPIFYCSRRVGKGGRYFTFWKFRSMYVGGPRRDDLDVANEKSGHIFKMRQDPRVTPVGRILRRLSFDELPQLFNVLAGEMSLVGPRPLPAEDLDPDGMSRKFADWATQRSLVRPGITGIWQIRGRSELPFNSMMELDVEYIRNWSLRLDLQILWNTPRAILFGEGAY
ncbi:MAG TPA: exopolysaccharide biosynthesis polyprenyl glycosylphosphotransferase [Bryobacteraceae bacterium]|jgi:exopolysaccharide biosynthesis polyprenyl glycosylphosphotransferase